MAKKLTREEIIRNARTLAAQLTAASNALESESNPDELLNHMDFVRDQGRIEALRKTIQERAIILFKALGRI
jgi:hypothetical protein